MIPPSVNLNSILNYEILRHKKKRVENIQILKIQRSSLGGKEINLDKVTLQSVNLLEEQRAVTFSDCNQFWRRKTQENHQKVPENHKVTVTMEMCD